MVRKLPLFLFLIFVFMFCAAAQTPKDTLSRVEFTTSSVDSDIVEAGTSARNKHSYTINRLANSAEEKRLIRIAESLYPKVEYVPNANGETFDPNVQDANAYRKGYVPPVELKPYWTYSIFDGVKIAQTVSLRSLKYYRDLVLAYQLNKNVPYPMKSTTLKYTADVKKHDQFQIGADQFSNVAVVKLSLSWSQYCGSLCAMGFEIEKIAVFDANGKPLALYVPEHTPYWVS
jgi:hypothetical protein